MGNRGGGAVRKDRRGRLKETRHGTAHMVCWRPAELGRRLARPRRSER